MITSALMGRHCKLHAACGKPPTLRRGMSRADNNAGAGPARDGSNRGKDSRVRAQMSVVAASILFILGRAPCRAGGAASASIRATGRKGRLGSHEVILSRSTLRQDTNANFNSCTSAWCSANPAPLSISAGGTPVQASCSFCCADDSSSALTALRPPACQHQPCVMSSSEGSPTGSAVVPKYLRILAL